MIEIYKKLLVGKADDFESRIKFEKDWFVVHACKEPYHRMELGYVGRSAPKNHPEYLIARLGNRLVLNLIDPPDPAFVPKEIIDAAIDFMHGALTGNSRVFVHCNQGESRAPSIGLLYLGIYTERILSTDFEGSENEYRSIYPSYNPSPGMRGFLKNNWNSYCQIFD